MGKRNEYGEPLDSNGYAPSVMQFDTSVCYLCGRRGGKLDRHEPWHGLALRQKSKRYGMWCMLCHDTCHLNGAHRCPEINRKLMRDAQIKAMGFYGWTPEEFIEKFGKDLRT